MHSGIPRVPAHGSALLLPRVRALPAGSECSLGLGNPELGFLTELISPILIEQGGALTVSVWGVFPREVQRNVCFGGSSLTPWDEAVSQGRRWCSSPTQECAYAPALAAPGPPLGFLCSSACEAEFNYRG